MFNSIGQPKKKSKIKNFIKSQFAKHTKHKNTDDFIIRFSANNNQKMNNKQLTDHRRLVFVSLIGLYQSYQTCTPSQLYSSLMLIPLKRQWIYEPIKYEQEYKVSFLSQMNIFQDTAKNQEFIELLKWKDSQGCVFWMLDKYTNNNENMHTSTAAFWQHLSNKLVNLYDPVTGNKYKPIEFDDEWWENIPLSQFKFAKCDNNVKSILHELSFLSMKYKQIQEIIYQSNPESFNPIVVHLLNDNTGTCNSTKNTVYTHNAKANPIDDILNDSNWVILDTYDPYDVDNDILSDC